MIINILYNHYLLSLLFFYYYSFSNPEIIKKLLNYITNPPEELDELKKLK